MSLSTTGRGDISCVGQSFPFDGPTNLLVDQYQLPATCLITMEGKRGVFQVYGTGSIRCNVDGTAVVCDKMVVQ